MLTGWSLVRIRPGEPPENQQLSLKARCRASAKINPGPRLGPQKGSLAMARRPTMLRPSAKLTDDKKRAAILRLEALIKDSAS